MVQAIINIQECMNGTHTSCTPNVWENEVNQQSLEIGHRIFVKVGTYDPPVSTAKMTLMTFPPDKILFATRIDPYHMARE